MNDFVYEYSPEMVGIYFGHLQNMTIQYTGNKYQEVLNTTGSMMLSSLYEQYPEKNTIEFFPSEQVSPFSRNQFAEEALEAGCRYAIVDDPSVIKDSRYVDNALQTLQQLAIYHHNRLKTPITGITGTCGKTTTKELTASVLSTKYKIVFTKWTENSSLSISLALLRLKPEHDLTVIEMGAVNLGGIRELSRIAHPSYGIITNVGLTHIEGFGSFEVVIHAKGELYDSLRQSGGKVFIHKENKYDL